MDYEPATMILEWSHGRGAEGFMFLEDIWRITDGSRQENELWKVVDGLTALATSVLFAIQTDRNFVPATPNMRECWERTMAARNAVVDAKYFRSHHPELQEGEVFIGNALRRGRGIWSSGILRKFSRTRRIGMQAFDEQGNLLPEHRPVFAPRSDALKAGIDC